MSEIWESNAEFLLERSVLNKDYFSFVWSIINLYTHRPNHRDTNGLAADDPFLQTVQFATLFLFQVYSHASDKPMFDAWVRHLVQVYTISFQASRWLLHTLITTKPLVKQLFLQCPFENLRKSFASIFAAAIKSVAAEEERLPEQHSVLSELLEFLMSPKMLRCIRRYPRNCGQYFLLLNEIALLSPSWRKRMLDFGVVGKLVEFSSAQGDWILKPDSKSQHIIPRMSPSNMLPILGVISLLVRSCQGPFLGQLEAEVPKVKPAPTLVPPGKPVYTLPPHDTKLLLDRNFLSRTIRESPDISYIVDIAQHSSYEDHKSTKMWIALFKDSFTNNVLEGYKPWFKLMNHLLEVQDTLANWRLDLALMTCLQLIESNVRRKDFTEAFVQYLVRLAGKNDTAKVWLFKHKEPLNKVLFSAGYKVS